NLVLVIAFALYAVIMLSRTTLAAKQIDDRVRVIVTEVGPGSNVSRLDETQKLNSVGQTAEDIQRAAQNLSAQAQTIIDVSGSIDGHVSSILGNANEINATVKSINSTASALLPVVRNINGDDSFDARSGGVAAINMRAARATPVVSGISTDLEAVFNEVGAGGTAGHGPANLDTIHNDVNSINCALTDPSGGLLGTVGGLLNTILGGLQGAPPGCNLF
ncbi:MAG: hypothetical protein ACLGI2_00540, partial [Acidimicrobiia bacterium]